MNKREIIERLKNIAEYAVHIVGEELFVMSIDDGIAVHEAIELLEQQEPLTSYEQAIDYLHKTGWLQNHDKILTESKVSLKGIWRDYTDEGYVECPICKSATNCESKEDIDELHFCFSCGAMLKRGEADGCS